MAPSKKQELMRAAYHEAGHAVVAIASGKTPRKVSIIPDEDTRGHCLFRVGNLKMDEYTYTNSGATRSAGERYIMSSLAGWEAEKVLLGRRLRRHTSPSDLNDAIDCALKMVGGDQDLMEPYFEWLRRRTVGVLGFWWPAVEAVADRLLKEREITGKRAREIALRAARGGLEER